MQDMDQANYENNPEWIVQTQEIQQFNDILNKEIERKHLMREMEQSIHDQGKNSRVWQPTFEWEDFDHTNLAMDKPIKVDKARNDLLVAKEVGDSRNSNEGGSCDMSSSYNKQNSLEGQGMRVLKFPIKRRRSIVELSQIHVPNGRQRYIKKSQDDAIDLNKVADSMINFGQQPF
ncbi:hypothetical protein AMTRI_Chr02g211880 [Amborella trichopoda]